MIGRKRFKMLILLIILVFTMTRIEAAYKAMNENKISDAIDTIDDTVENPENTDIDTRTETVPNQSDSPRNVKNDEIEQNQTDSETESQIESEIELEEDIISSESESEESDNNTEIEGTEAEGEENQNEENKEENKEENNGNEEPNNTDNQNEENEVNEETEGITEANENEEIDEGLDVEELNTSEGLISTGLLPENEPLIDEAIAVASPYYATEEYGSPYVNGVLSNKKLEWNFIPNNDFQPPRATKEFDIRQFDAYYLGDINSKVIYLTFDEGYENGYTPMILDTLRDKNVKAAFFVTKPYIERNKDLIKRMVDEGHIVANHSTKHRSSPSLTDEEFISDTEEVARYYKEVTGHEIGKYFRPPMGEYSARTLHLTQQLGYKTIFWSFAYKDWDVDNQPGSLAAFNAITSRVHNGCIMLLHAVSESNTQALPDVIDYLHGKGFTFKTLDDL